MLKPIGLGSLLLVTTALTAPALAQTRSGAPAPASTPSAGAPATQGQEQVEISAPGAGASDVQDIVVVGRNIPEPIRATPEVISVLSQADIARTGEGDIAGALQRVTGLSVVGNGFVYVRGLGDRYSLALLNGSPLPSPEPLRRVVPLDIFPTGVLASSLVQKSYSANYPGEFGGGVINLTTRAIPTESFLTINGSVSGDSITTMKLGYTYYGSDTDWLGYDDGQRRLSSAQKSAITSGIGNLTRAQRQDFAAGLTNAKTTVVQRNTDIPANFAADVSAGTAFDVGSDGKLGVIFAGGYSSNWRTRGALQQFSTDPGLANISQNYRAVITDNRVLVNGLLGLGYEFGDQKIRWTNLYIHDTIKQTSMASGYNTSIQAPVPGEPDQSIKQGTYWFERQLIDTQLIGEFKFGDFSVDARGSYANSKRKSPYERNFAYSYNATAKDYINNLSSGGQTADIAFSDLNENVYSGAIDLGYKLPTARPITISGGYNYTKTDRTSSRYQFDFFRQEGALPFAVAQERPDYLISDYNIYTYGIELRDVSGATGSAAYDAKLEVNAGYGQVEGELADGLRATVGVRYEDALQTVLPLGADLTRLKNNYWLPAGTITWNFAENMQLRLAGSKTIARPQFRELAPQLYQDYESNRQFTGNPNLQDSTLWNAEARYEWYFGRDQRLSLAGFYKKINNPIEAVAFFDSGNTLRTGFANAPEAQLYGGEVELQKYFSLDTLNGDFFAARRVVLIANYTYTQSKLKVDDSMVIGPSLTPVAADTLFRDGAPLTGQSDHLVNLQIGLENTDHLSQQTLLVTYASKRVTNRGPIGDGGTRLPDIIEKPGLKIDFVAREEAHLYHVPLELKFEARNLTATRYQEFQTAGSNRVDVNTYNVGRSFSLGIGVKF